MKQYADKHRSERVFAKGDSVYLKLRSFVQSSIKTQKYSKIGPKFYGPFLILEKIGAVAYKLDLPADSQIHPVFHVSLLKKAHGNHLPNIPLPASPKFMFQPRAIVDKRLVRRGTKLVHQVLVHWHGVPLTDATWEFENEFQLRFPAFNS
ncbi:uncharacterized protein LOC143576282 [Bidens hawaiensis]|uniref:uncharacterized protein LOC143576282 n=1 Tax=Bidens hawaiensis TaxID=980011 RepID=UPI00404A4545